MTFDFYIFRTALQQGNWFLIPAMLLAIGFCCAVVIGIPRLFAGILQSAYTIQLKARPYADRINQWLRDFLFGSSTLLRWTIQFLFTAIVLAGVILLSASLLNCLAGREMFSLIGNPDKDYTLAMGLSGGALLGIGVFLTFWIRALASGEDALRIFNFSISLILSLLSLVAAGGLYGLNAGGIWIIPLPILVVLFLLCPYFLFMAFRQVL